MITDIRCRDRYIKCIGKGLRDMDNLKRIFNKFEDLNDFAGYRQRKKYAEDILLTLEDKELDEETMDIIRYYQGKTADEAFIDGFRFGVKMLVECSV